uniref:Reverse transcriptase domain-containing protein n=1 Tax=Pygocentrus nattereri TaxID=42514 RepID=A0AAR2JVL9_PYGNA
MWKGIQAITGYRPPSLTPSASSASLPDELNQFYARFDQRNDQHSTWSGLPHNESPLTLSTDNVQSVLSKVHARKAAGPDGVPGRVLRACAGQLAKVFTDIFNLSLAQAAVPACWKTSTIIPVPKCSSAACPNDFRPVALTPIVMKCFEKLVLNHLKTVLPPSLDSHQFAYRANRSTEDAISTALHSALTHLDERNTYIRMLFIDLSSAFNMVIPTRLVTKLSDLGISTPMCNWVLEFLTDRPQSVRLGSHMSTTITLNTGVPQGCVLSPLLFSLFTHDCVPLHTSNILIKFADDTTVVGHIRNNDESAYREEIQHLTSWCTTNNLILNTGKTKELIVDYRKTKGCTHSPVYINGAEVERVSSFRFLGIHISADLSWSFNTSHLIKKAQQRLYFLRRLKQDRLSPQILTNFYRCTIESILTNCVTVWYSSSTVAERKSLQRVVRTAQRITGMQLPAIKDIHHQRCVRRAHSIIKDPSHPNHKLFNLLPSRRRYKSIRARTSRLRSSFFPSTITLLNSTPR